MRRLLLAPVVVALLATAAPAAHAEHADYRGGCGYDTVRQDTATGDKWVGEVSVVIVATDTALGAPAPTVPITGVWCELVVNNVSRGSVLTAPDGTGVTAAAAPVSLSFEDTDYVTLCTHATVGGHDFVRCAGPGGGPFPPQPVIDAINEFIDVLYETVGPWVPQLACPWLPVLGPVVNALNQPELLRIEWDGDLYLFGDLLWDCPPFVVT